MRIEILAPLVTQLPINFIILIPCQLWYGITMLPDISYLILNYNPDGEAVARDVLAATLKSFYERKSRNLRAEVFLFDQGSPDFHRTWLLERQKQYGFSSIFLNRNIGISRALNLFVRTCKSPVIGLITSDVLITTGMDEDLYEIVQIPEVYQATPYADKSDVEYQIWQPGKEYGSDHLDYRVLKRDKGSLLRHFLKGRNQRYLRYIGAEFNVMFWRREVFDRVGYFDEYWKAAYENNDFSLRCFLAGGCTALSLGSFVWHYHKVTEKNRSREKTYVGYVENWREEMKGHWDEKWTNLHNYIDLYKPLGDKTITDFPVLYDRFKNNIYLPFDQPIEYD